MNDLKFTPCSEHCPVITGEPYGSLRYCPMQENFRHRNLDVLMNGVSKNLLAYPQGHHPYYDHKDYSDCCLNFQCCNGEIEKSGLAGLFESLTEAVSDSTN